MAHLDEATIRVHFADCRRETYASVGRRVDRKKTEKPIREMARREIIYSRLEGPRRATTSASSLSAFWFHVSNAFH